MAKAKRPSKMVEQDAGPILPPGTYIVDNPEWDRDAPNLDLAEPAKRKQAAAEDKAPPPSASQSQPVNRTTAISAFALLGGVILASVAFGIWKFIDVREEKAAKVELAKAEAEAEAKAEAEAAKPKAPPTLEEIEAEYRRHVAETAATLGVEAPSVDALREANTFEHLVSHGSTVTISPGTARTLGSLRLKVRVDTLNLQRGGIQSKGQHTMLEVTNTTDRPLAYRLIVRKAEIGDCRSPVVFNYDAMVIDAGAKTEVSVCSGRQSAEIIDLRTLSLTEVGARWIRQIPPLAVGNEPMAAKSHEVAEDIEECHEDTTEIARMMAENLVKWEDVIDFYSRHDCQHYAWASEYRLAKAPLEALPVLPSERDSEP